MKRILFFLTVLMLAATIISAESIINDIEDFSKLFPRIEGSTNEKAAFKHISMKLDELNINYAVINFDDTAGYHSFSSYIDAEIPGLLKNTLITIIPVDMPGATIDRYNGSYGMAAALQLIEYYSKHKPQLSMRFVFLGAEHGSGEQYPLGSRNFLETYYPEESTAFIYFNFKNLPTAFRLVSGANGYSTPFWLFDSIGDALKGAAIPYYHSNIESILFRLSAAEDNSLLADYLSEGYPSIEITDFTSTGSASEAAENGRLISSEQMINFYNLLISSRSGGFPPDWDDHYLFSLSEQQYLLVYILLLMLLMIFPIFRRRHFGWYMRSLFKNFWIIPVLFGFIFGLLAVSSLLISTLLQGLKFPSLWKYYTLPFFVFKLSLTLLAYSLFVRLLLKLPFSKRGSFYSISAIFFLVISLFVLTLIDLSLSIFALWPLCFIFLFTIFRRPVVKLLFLLISAVWIVYGLVEIFLLNSLKVIELITLSPVKGNLLFALILLPFILASIRLDMLSHPSKRITRFAPVFFSVVSAGFLILILTYSPFDESNPQPVTITKLIEEGQTDIILIESPAQIPGIHEEDLLISILPSGDNIDVLDINVESEAFLNRKIVKTIINMPEAPEKINILMHSDDSITLFESSYPATWFPSRKILEVYIGKNPPVPLEFSLTLNRAAELDYTISAEYPVYIDKQRILDNIYSIDYRKTIIKHYSNAN
ncbi:MAG: hypothetical protein JEZ04_03320 [Spirochaetales bacterium]|nr:hypothetical protein [Spirochaetales bacterium]